MIEIGGGASSFISSYALKLNEENGFKNDHIIIEPYPSKYLLSMPNIDKKLIIKKLEEIDIDYYKNLEAGDILFFDTSHTSKAFSDINFIFFKILPALKKGVIIHFHDILLPAEYIRKWLLNDNFFWNEQYVFCAFMMYNDDFKTLWSGSYLMYKYMDLIKKYIVGLESFEYVGSYWIIKE